MSITVYLAGPMAGVSYNNHPAFDRAARVLRSLGYIVFNPAETSRAIWTAYSPSASLQEAQAAFERDHSDEVRRQIYYKRDLANLLLCDRVVLLPGWRWSRGATLEVLVAVETGIPLEQYGVGMITVSRAAARVLHERAEAPWSHKTPETFEPPEASEGTVPLPPESILLEADRLVNGIRQRHYGHPLDNWTFTANLWNAFLAGKYKTPCALVAEDALTMMILVKLAREAHSPKRDNLVDVAGYAKCTDMVVQERKRRDEQLPDNQEPGP